MILPIKVKRTTHTYTKLTKYLHKILTKIFFTTLILMALPANKKRKISRSKSPELSITPTIITSIGTPTGSQSGSNDEDMDINTNGVTQQQQPNGILNRYLPTYTCIRTTDVYVQ